MVAVDDTHLMKELLVLRQDCLHTLGAAATQAILVPVVASTTTIWCHYDQ